MSKTEDAGSVERPHAAEWKPSREVVFIMVGLVCVLFMVALDSTILSASLPNVAEALEANAVQAYWIVASYLLANAVVQPVVAALADVYGRRIAILASVLIFAIGSIVCCVAQNVATMLAGRTVQGIGGGGILSVNLIILSDILPLRHRSKYVGIMTLFNSIGVNIGPVVGAALIKTSWRWIFYINFPFCAIGLIVIPLVLRYVQPETTTYQKLSQVDWAGSCLFMVGTTSFLVGLSWGGNQYNWASAATQVPLVLGAVLVVGTVAYERSVASRPFLRLSLFCNWTAVIVYLCTTLQSLTLFCELYFITLYLRGAKLYSPLHAAALLLAFAFFVVPVSGIVGVLIARAGSYKWFVITGWVVNTAGLGVLVILGSETGVVALVFILLFAGLGQGILFISQQIATQAACKNEDAGYAAAMFSFMRSLGFCLGLVLGGTIFQNLFRRRLISLGLPAEIAADAEAMAAQLKNTASPEMLASLVNCYAWAIRMLFAAMTGISGLGFILSLMVKDYSLDQDLDSKHKLQSATSRQAQDMEKNGGPVHVAEGWVDRAGAAERQS